MSHSACETCGGLPPLIKTGPFAGSRYELRYCAYCSKDLCDKCLADPTCRETPMADRRHRVETDCPDSFYDACGEGCRTCDGDGIVRALIEEAIEWEAEP